MDIINVKDLKNIDEGIEYIYSRSNFATTNDIKQALLRAKPNKLPQAYICTNKGIFIGCLILATDDIKYLNTPFRFMLMHHIDLEFRLNNIHKLYQFISEQCDKFEAFNLKARLNQGLNAEIEYTKKILDFEKRRK